MWLITWLIKLTDSAEGGNREERIVTYPIPLQIEALIRIQIRFRKEEKQEVVISLDQ